MRPWCNNDKGSGTSSERINDTADRSNGGADGCSDTGRHNDLVTVNHDPCHERPTYRRTIAD
jgi:hypothetical protein